MRVQARISLAANLQVQVCGNVYLCIGKVSRELQRWFGTVTRFVPISAKLRENCASAHGIAALRRGWEREH